MFGVRLSVVLLVCAISGLGCQKNLGRVTATNDDTGRSGAAGAAEDGSVAIGPPASRLPMSYTAHVISGNDLVDGLAILRATSLGADGTVYMVLSSRLFKYSVSSGPEEILVTPPPGYTSLWVEGVSNNGDFIARADNSQFLFTDNGTASFRIDPSLGITQVKSISESLFSHVRGSAQDYIVRAPVAGQGNNDLTAFPLPLSLISPVLAESGVVYGSVRDSGASLLKYTANLGLQNVVSYPGNTAIALAVNKAEDIAYTVSTTDIPEQNRIHLRLRNGSDRSFPQFPKPFAPRALSSNHLAGGTCRQSPAGPGVIDLHACVVDLHTGAMVDLQSFTSERVTGLFGINDDGLILTKATGNTLVLFTPDQPMIKAGDADCNGVVNNFDIQPFSDLIVNQEAWQAQHPGCNALVGDIDGDGRVTNFDIDPFVSLLVQ